MCGIAGLVVPGDSVSMDVIQRMTRCIAHRGPDAEGFYSEGGLAFGHRRLSIIDLSEAANQPMTSRDGRWVMMFNGEVFNFREIASALKVPLRTHSDTEVMLESFAAFGADAVQQFNGMFAIALYDRHEKILYLFRDRIGVKPLFYFHENNRWFFASEIKALLAVEEIKGHLTINHEAISLFLQLGYIPEPFTIWKQIKKFPAGNYVRITERDHYFHSYWKAEEKISATVISNRKAAKQQLRELLESSVRYRMISDVPFGVFLSGGIDSSLVTAISQQESNVPVKTFTIGFKEARYNEAPHAKKIAEYLKTDHHEFTLHYTDALELCEQSMDAYDEPFAESSAIPTMLVSKHAGDQVKMVLSGDGGDELFMGYGMYRWAKRLRHPLIRSIRSPLARSLSLMSNRYQRAATMFQFDDEANLPQHIFSQEQYFFSRQEAKKLLGKNFVSGENNFPDAVFRKLSAAEKQALYDLKYYLKDDLLVKVDRATMLYALECRTPFLDYRIVEFALNVAEKLKMRRGELKILLRDLLGDFLPQKLFERPKQGFAIPLQQWLKKELQHLPEHYLSEKMVKRYSVLNYKEVAVLKKKFFAGQDYLYKRLWNLIALQRWLEKNNC